MKKTYIQPETREQICRDAFCSPMSVGLASEEKGGSNAWSREEEDFSWDEEAGW